MTEDYGLDDPERDIRAAFAEWIRPKPPQQEQLVYRLDRLEARLRDLLAEAKALRVLLAAELRDRSEQQLSN